jgi:poly-gamma-glutamate synthesis protein (capsule biosynthesis protein)
MEIHKLVCGLSSFSCTLFLVACGSLSVRPISTLENPSTGSNSLTVTATPFQPEGYVPLPVVPTTQNTAEPVQTPPPAYLWISPAVPDVLRQFALGSGLSPVGDSANALVRLDVSQTSDSQGSSWVYALVVPFPTITDGLSLSDIKNSWSGVPSGLFTGRPLWMDYSTLAAFSAIWGPPAAGAISVAAADTLLDSAWAERPAWAIVPFELLDPRWKVLSVDGQSPVHNDFNLDSYPLKINYSLSPPVFPLMSSNRDANKLTVLAMTGVTALVRATADRMELHGVLYPGEEIRSVLRAADITHISNEIPFMSGCPTPDPWTDSLRFCSDPRYIALLEDVGTDMVELTGNHLMDYGPQPILSTLDMYDQRGWRYFGGGRNLQASLQPALMEDHGNKFAFVGCNYAGPPSDWATDSLPGSTPCDLDQLSVEISNLRSTGYIPIMTFQYNEYYQPNPTDYEQRDFLKMASAGAVIVSGSQAHVPAAMEFSGGSFVHYGLGNLFFDQMSHLMPDGSVIYDTRDVFVDRHVFYNGRYISTELLSYIIEDYSRPRPMTGSERQELLQKIFSAGGW